MSVTTPDFQEAGYLLSAYGEHLGAEGDYAGAQRALDSAMAIARHEGDIALEMSTLINTAWVDVQHLRLQESLDKSLQAIELADKAEDSLSGSRPTFMPLGHRATDCIRKCEADERNDRERIGRDNHRRLHRRRHGDFFRTRFRRSPTRHRVRSH